MKPFKAYTVINCSVAQSLGCSDIYRFYVLSLTTDRNNSTDTTLEQLAYFVGENSTAYKGGMTKDKKKKLSLTNRFRASGEFKSITSDKEYSNISGKRVTRNTYVIKEAVIGSYRRIKRSFTDLDLPIKLKGYILKLFCIAEPHSYLVMGTPNSIAKAVKMSKKTVECYNEQLINANLLEVIDGGFLLKVDSLQLDAPNRCLTPEHKQFVDLLENKIIPRKLHKGIPLDRWERAYLYEKAKDFSGIRNMNNFIRWTITGVPFRRKDKQVSTPDILVD